MEPIKVVARYTNGTIVKGFTQDFSPNKDRFHIIPVDNRSGRTVEVFVSRLKAIFVVRDFNGDPQYKERERFVKVIKYGSVHKGRKSSISRYDAA